MPVATPTLLTSGNSTANAASYDTASVAPVGNRLILVAIAIQVFSGGTPTLSLSGCGLTWEQIATLEFSTASTRIAVFRSMGAAPSSGPITITTTGGGTKSGITWHVIEVGDVSTSGSNGAGAVVQSANNSSTGNSPNVLSVTLAALADAVNNATLAFFANDGASVAAPGTGYTELADTAAAGATALQTIYRIPGTTTPDVTVATDWFDVAGIAIEVAAGSAGFSDTVAESDTLVDSASSAAAFSASNSESDSLEDRPGAYITFAIAGYGRARVDWLGLAFGSRGWLGQAVSGGAQSGTVAEVGTTNDSATSAAVFAGSLVDSDTFVDIQTASQASASAVVETATETDSQSAAWITASSCLESSSPVDLSTAAQTMPAAVAESISEADTQDSTFTGGISGIFADSVTIADLQSALQTAFAVRDELVTSAEAQSTALVAAVLRAETALPVDLQSSWLIAAGSRIEMLTAVDGVVAFMLGDNFRATDETAVIVDNVFAVVYSRAAPRASIDSSRVVPVQRARPSVVQAGRPRN